MTMSVPAHLHVAIVDAVVQCNHAVACIHHSESLPRPAIGEGGVVVAAAIHVVAVHAQEAVVSSIVPWLLSLRDSCTPRA